MGQNNRQKPKLKISYKISNGSLQLRLSWAQSRLIDSLQNLSPFEQGLKFAELQNANEDFGINDVRKYQQLYIGTGITLAENEWDKSAKKLLGGATIHEQKLTLLIKQIERLYEHLLKSQLTPPSVEAMRMAINKFIRTRESLIPTHEEIVERQERKYVVNGKINRPLLPKMPFSDYIVAKCDEWRKYANKKKQTKEAFSGLLAFIKLYEDDKNTNLKIQDLSEEFFIDFFHFIKFCNPDKTYKVSYVNKIFRQCRTFGYSLRDVEKYPLLINWKHEAFPRSSEESDEVALTLNEVLLVHRLVIPQHKTAYRKVRDLFVFGCLTGLRYSDLKRANVELVNGKWKVRMTMKKVRDKITIPLHPIAKKIWDSYEGKWPSLNEVAFNEIVKILCADAGLTQSFQISYTDTRTNELVTVTYPFNELVYSSTCRRTFATLLVYHYKLNPEIARRFTGHRKLASFLKYLRITDEQADELLANKFEGSEDSVVLK